MGERSKKIGEVGERLVIGFLQRIGWVGLYDPVDISCEKPDKHQRASAKKPRYTHGVDMVFSYLCPYVPNVRRVIIISVKNSDHEKTNNMVSTVGSDIKELEHAIDCFEVSEMRRAILAKGGASTTTDIGLLIRINRDPVSQKSFLGDGGSSSLKLEGTNPIYFVENDRFDFVDCCMDYLARHFDGRDNCFYIHKNSLNSNGEARKTDSPLLPIQNLVGGPIAVKSSYNESREFVIFSDQKFSEFCFEKMVGLALACSHGWASKILIVFEDYDRTEEPLVKNVLARLDDRVFASTVKCDSFSVKSRLK